MICSERYTKSTFYTYSEQFILIVPNILVTLVVVIRIFNVTLWSGEYFLPTDHDACSLETRVFFGAQVHLKLLTEREEMSQIAQQWLVPRRMYQNLGEKFTKEIEKSWLLKILLSIQNQHRASRYAQFATTDTCLPMRWNTCLLQLFPSFPWSRFRFAHLREQILMQLLFPKWVTTPIACGWNRVRKICWRLSLTFTARIRCAEPTEGRNLAEIMLAEIATVSSDLTLFDDAGQQHQDWTKQHQSRAAIWMLATHR